jgi:predicted GNAT family acetyltransferase
VSETVADEVRHEDDGTAGTFSIWRDGRRVGVMTYHYVAPGKVVVDHTQVDSALRRHGLARVLVDAAVAWARSEHRLLLPRCSYVEAVFDRDPSIADVRALIDGEP